MRRPIFSTGLVRSGTTLFARILSSNSEVKVTNDPFLPIFRSLRNSIMRDSDVATFDAESPLDDYYFCDDKLQVMRKIIEADLSIVFPETEKILLSKQLKDRIEFGAKELRPYISEVQGDTYKELFQSGLDAVHKAFSGSAGEWCGFNDNWIIDYFPALAKAFPEAHFVAIIRDPRAIVTSLLKLRERQPAMVPLMYSVVRYWRKHASFARMLKSFPDLEGRYTVIKYEDMVTDPEVTIGHLCDVLEIEFSKRMLDTEQFRPHSGDKWTSWSNHDVPSKGIYTDAQSAWVSFLSEEDVEFVEFICGPEMDLFGYDPRVYDQNCFPSSGVLKFMQRDEVVTKGWRGRHLPISQELPHELYRRYLLSANCDERNKSVIEKYFLFSELFLFLVPFF